MDLTSDTTGGGRDAIEELVARNLQLDDRRDSLVAQIAIDVAVRIMEGELDAGADVNSVELAQRFGTSRTPVREALMLLEKQGLVQIPARRRPTVIGVEEFPIEDIYRARAVLTGYMSELVAERQTPETMARLAESLAAMRKACDDGDPQAYFWANIGWGEVATAIVGNAIVADFIDQLGLRSLQLRRRSMSLPGRMQRSMIDHERLYEAFGERDSQLASLISRKLIRDAYRALVGDDASQWRL